jgi:Zn finger protein HypA/HybF involved in hydrogenase expression
MSAAYVVGTLAATPFFASRAFLATFVTAALARWGAGLPLVGDSQTLELLAGAPAWFTHDLTLLALGGLAVLEFVAARNPDARALLDELDTGVKAAMQLGVALALIPSDSAGLLGVPAVSGLPWELGWVAVVTGVVVGLSRLRAASMRLLRDLDPGDDVGIQGLLAWAEDGWVIFGLSFAAFFPLAAVALFVLSLGALVAAERAIAWLEERGRVPCGSCAHPLHAAALHCPACGVERPEHARIGWLAHPVGRHAEDDDSHGLELVRRGRCPHCAERLPARTRSQVCGACHTVTFDGDAELQRYVAHLDRQLPIALVVCFAFGLVPLLGIVPGVLFGQLWLVSGALRYAPPLPSVGARWVGRLATILLVMLQPVPVFGALTLPLICAARYLLARRALLGVVDAAMA